jgi:hypothetical protein
MFKFQPNKTLVKSKEEIEGKERMSCLFIFIYFIIAVYLK